MSPFKPRNGLIVGVDRGPLGTAAGEILGTPAYMPPEQALGDEVDQRADVYSLGSVIYHMISGRPPRFVQSRIEALVSAISNVPKELDSRTSEVPADLIAIVTKAMSQLPQDRYADCGQMARDLRNFVNGQLVSAHTYTGRQLVRRWAAKYRRRIAATAVAVAATTVLGAYSVKRVVSERDRARVAERIADDSRNRANEVMDFTIGELASQLKPVGKLELLALPARRAVDYYASTPFEQRTERDVLRLHDARAIAADVLGKSTDCNAAATMQLESVTLLERTQFSPEKQVHAAVGKVQALYSAAQMFQRCGNLARALETANRSAQEAMQLREAVRDKPQFSFTVLAALNAAAEVALRASDVASAATASRAAIEFDTTTIGNSGDAVWLTERARTYAVAAIVAIASEDGPAALRRAQQGLTLAQEAAELAPGDAEVLSRVAINHITLSRAFWTNGDRAKKISEMESALEILEGLVARDPANKVWSKILADGYGEIGLVPGPLAQRQVYFHRAAALSRRMLAEQPTNLGAMASLAGALCDEGEGLLDTNAAAAVPVLEESCAQYREYLKQQPSDGRERLNLLSTVGNLALGYTRTGRMRAAVASLNEAKALHGMLTQEDHDLFPTVGTWLEYIEGAVLAGLGKKDQAVKLLRHVIRSFEQEEALEVEDQKALADCRRILRRLKLL